MLFSFYWYLFSALVRVFISKHLVVCDSFCFLGGGGVCFWEGGFGGASLVTFCSSL